MSGGAGRELRVLADPALEGARLLAEAAAAGGKIALAGGSTPRRAYERAAQLGGDWSRAVLWFGDERCVPPDHELSNFRMVRESLLDRLPGPPPAVRRIEGELGPEEGALAYDRALRAALSRDRPRLDLVLLGLGPDCHCASLFPSAPALAVEDRLATGVPHAGLEPLVPRVTLTLPALNAAARVVFLVAGADKAEAVASAFTGEPGRERPASLVLPRAGPPLVLLDEKAAARL